MKTTKDEIVLKSLALFAEKGFDAVSTSMIAESLGITKGALYRHFESKQAIFDRIIEMMFELDEQQANDNNVPAREYAVDDGPYKSTGLADLCGFVNEQFIFWTENEFACLFRRMLTLEQFRDEKMTGLYRDIISLGPVKYSADLFGEMIKNGSLSPAAGVLGAWNLALQLYAPLLLSVQLYDAGEDSETLKANLRAFTQDFENRWKNDN